MLLDSFGPSCRGIESQARWLSSLTVAAVGSLEDLGGTGLTVGRVSGLRWSLFCGYFLFFACLGLGDGGHGRTVAGWRAALWEVVWLLWWELEAGLAKRNMGSCLRSCRRVVHGDGTCQSCHMNTETARQYILRSSIVRHGDGNVWVDRLAALEQICHLPPSMTLLSMTIREGFATTYGRYGNSLVTQ